MKAVWITEPGSPDVLQVRECESPRLLKGHVRVQIKATALNRADLLQRQGLYPPPPGETEILGLEMSGVVVETANDVTGFLPGERVCALLPGGGYAQEVVVPAPMLAKIPDSLSFEEAAAIPEAFLTAYSNLVWLGQINPAHTVLIHAGASGVGTAAIQLVREFGATPIVTAGSVKKREVCMKLGAALAIDYHAGPFAPPVLEWTKKQGVNLIFDFIGSPYFEQNLQTLAIDGRLIVIGTMGGTLVDRFDLSLLLRRRLQVIGTALRSRTKEQKAQLTAEFWDFAFDRFADGRLRPLVDRIYPLEHVAEAHRYMESNLNIGKIVLRVSA
ncbi:NAD(P)H-quinone oxidoreductase [Sulfoacidibacillus thermotolerans]|uniref:NADPH:quinone oxidoreductase n=1 Tax=Sulfoacidibacillus thermotolerans TaxID=1765684 RepID=A0A2U3DBW0_SULT2|nr:NAD(P)H-quinone oxidoreductase [Sulfoacidibacillus thermotolerans]PWI58764.1 NADPH:quinone oxidoreductase [Sulfoacidibacillus thermotolerans]